MKLAGSVAKRRPEVLIDILGRAEGSLVRRPGWHPWSARFGPWAGYGEGVPAMGGAAALSGPSTAHVPAHVPSYQCGPRSDARPAP